MKLTTAEFRSLIVIRQVIGFSVLALGLSTFGYAQQQKIGVIHIQGAIGSTKDGQKAAAELETKAGPKRKELENKQNDINSLKDQLQKGANTLSDAAKNELYRSIDQKTKSLNRDMQDAQDEFQQEQDKILQGLEQKILAVINKYALDKGFTIILDVSNPLPVLWASNSIDITKDIIDLYDKESASGAPTAKPPINTATPPATRPTSTSTPGTPRPGTTTPAKKP
jgi:outer membrane protein